MKQWLKPLVALVSFLLIVKPFKSKWVAPLLQPISCATSADITILLEENVMWFTLYTLNFSQVESRFALPIMHWLNSTSSHTSRSDPENKYTVSLKTCTLSSFQYFGNQWSCAQFTYKSIVLFQWPSRWEITTLTQRHNCLYQLDTIATRHATALLLFFLSYP